MREENHYAGMDILLFGRIGEEGTKALVREEREKLSERLPEDFLAGIESWETPSVTVDSLRKETEAALVWPIGEGGLFSALWAMSCGADAGFCLDLKEVLLNQETIEVCEIFGLNPYRLLSGGCFLILSEDGSGLLWRYRGDDSGLFRQCRENGFPLRLVGKMSKDRDKKLYYGERIRYLNRPEADELSRIRGERPTAGFVKKERFQERKESKRE